MPAATGSPNAIGTLVPPFGAGPFSPFPPDSNGALEFWIDAAAAEGGQGTQIDPWGPLEGLEAARQQQLRYARIDQCIIHLLGAGPFQGPADAFDGGPFGGTGRFAIIGDDYDVLLAGLLAAAGTSLTRVVLTAAVAGGIDQYIGKTVEVLDGAAAGDRRTIVGHKKRYDCRVATVGASITLAGGAPDTLDGVALAANDRVLVKNQAAPAQNGIYFVQTLGTGANGTWARALDADSTGELNDARTTVTAGTVNANTSWYQTALVSSLGVSTVTWSQNDTLLVPCRTFAAGVAAGTTLRIFGPLAVIEPRSVVNEGVAIVPRLLRGFAQGGASTNVSGAIGTLPTANGAYLINCAIDSVAGATVIEETKLYLFGFEGRTAFPVIREHGVVLSGLASQTQLAFLGVTRSLAWLGWGTFSPFVVAIEADAPWLDATLVCSGLNMIRTDDGRQYGSLANGRIVGDILIAGGVLELRPLGSQNLLLDGIIAARALARVVLHEQGVFFCASPVSAAADALINVADNAEVLIRTNGAHGWYAHGKGLDASDGGGSIRFSGTLDVRGNGAANDAVVRSVGQPASFFGAAGAGIGDYGVLDPTFVTGAVIARLA